MTFIESNATNQEDFLKHLEDQGPVPFGHIRDLGGNGSGAIA